MPTRRDVLKLLAGSLLSSGAVAPLVQGCAGGLPTYRAKVADKRMVLPKAEADALAAPNGILVVRAAGLPGPIILRHITNNGIVALTSVCTHRGCELRPFPDSLRCPCHGSEFDEFGEVIQGPARQPLTRYNVEESETSYIVHIA